MASRGAPLSGIRFQATLQRCASLRRRGFAGVVGAAAGPARSRFVTSPGTRPLERSAYVYTDGVQDGNTGMDLKSGPRDGSSSASASAGDDPGKAALNAALDWTKASTGVATGALVFGVGLQWGGRLFESPFGCA